MEGLQEVTCCGMERSASTLTWQMMCNLTGDEVAKTHEYVKGAGKIIYTYRHPVEAYYSLRRCFSQIYPVATACQLALKAIKLQEGIYERYKKDAQAGRPVLFLKYENYYHHPQARLYAIAAFMEVGNDKFDVSQILEATSIQKNIVNSIGKGNFGNHDTLTGLHGNHIDAKFKGIPGEILRHVAQLLPADDPLWTDSQIKNVIHAFGYK